MASILYMSTVITQVQAGEEGVEIQAQWLPSQLRGATAASVAWKEDLQVLVTTCVYMQCTYALIHKRHALIHKRSCMHADSEQNRAAPGVNTARR